jgi:hypothetical protein
MTRLVRASGLLAASLALLAAATVAGCGSQPEAGWQTFDNPQYQFSIGYDAGRFTPHAPINARIKTGAKSGYGVGFIPDDASTAAPTASEGVTATPSGNVVTLYVVQVTTYSSPWTAKKVAALKPYFVKSVAGMTKTLGAKVTGPVRETIAGAPAWRIEATLTSQGTELHMRIHYVFHGSNEYELVEQATAGDWPANAPVYRRMTDSFTFTD